MFWPVAGHAMMLSPLLKKAEEKAGIKSESPESKNGSPPTKKLCTLYSRQLARLPAGDQGLVKEGVPKICWILDTLYIIISSQ